MCSIHTCEMLFRGSRTGGPRPDQQKYWCGHDISLFYQYFGQWILFTCALVSSGVCYSILYTSLNL